MKSQTLTCQWTLKNNPNQTSPGQELQTNIIKKEEMFILSKKKKKPEQIPKTLNTRFVLKPENVNFEELEDG